ncbi:hypothetical protein ACEWY4_007730 [Coilia grayii]|uniref:G-protein coupled receptors family 1 profile domain-containing protein n=1 Tax=Coilia grayii TaxID=363190 RepID=A0ABD1K900_9TELE
MMMDPGGNDSNSITGWRPPTNQTDLLGMFSGAQLLLRFKPLFVPLYAAVVLVAGVGNAFLLACIVADRKLHNATNFFIGNLAAGDLLMCLSCVPLTASYAFEPRGWAFGRPLCHLVPLIQGATVFASVLSLTAIAMDRYVVVAYPVRRRISMWGCSAVATGIWLLALALAAPPALQVRLVDLRPSGVDFLVCEEFWEAERLRLLYSCFFMLASYMIPLLAVSVSYCAISLHLRRNALPGEMCQQHQRWSQRRRRTFSLLVASVLAFALCWLPLQVLNLMLDLDGDFRFVDKHYLNVLQVSCHLLAMSSACYNPFIYASLHSKVRLHLRGYLWPCGHGSGQERRSGGGGGGSGSGIGRAGRGGGRVVLLSHSTLRNPNTTTSLNLLSEQPEKENQYHPHQQQHQQQQQLTGEPQPLGQANPNSPL